MKPGSVLDARTITITLAVLALAGLLAYGWSTNMELRSTAQKRDPDADPASYMLAARTLLRQHGRQVNVVDSMSQIDFKRHPAGTLVMADTAGLMTISTAKDVLAWVRRGNTLLIRPRVMNMEEARGIVKWRAAAAAEAASVDKEDAEEDSDGETKEDDKPWVESETTPITAMSVEEIDPIGSYVGARLFIPPSDLACLNGIRKSCPQEDGHPQTRDGDKDKDKDKETRPPRRMSMLASPYPLELAPSSYELVSVGENDFFYAGDEQGTGLRVYMLGKGYVVMLGMSYFSNKALRQYDHGELLLALARLNPASKHVTIVRHLDVPRWYVAIWKRYKLAIISLGCTLLLLLWAALRRFGPMLPIPSIERRSLMEHIAASGAWLWKAEGGRQQLLEAARRDTLALIRLRAPALARMQPDPMAEALATLAGVTHSHVIEALQSDALPQVAQFTRQIRTLQILRNHYER